MRNRNLFSFTAVALCLFLAVAIGTTKYSLFVAVSAAEDPARTFERDILWRLYHTLGGPGWNIPDGWDNNNLPDSEYCSWYGVTCFQNGFRDGLVEKIDLSQNNLTGVPDISIWKLVHMKELDLSKNDIEVSFEGIDQADQALSLERLQLAETKVSAIQGIEALTGLKYLNMTNCSITGTLPEELFEMTNLQGLYLSYNELNGTLPENIGNLVQLRELFFAGNNLTGTIPDMFVMLQQIEILNLGFNEITGTLPPLLGSLQELRVNTPKLRDLYLSHNHLVGDIPDDFLGGVESTTTETIHVDLSSNIINGRIPNSLARFDDLRLDLTGNLVREIPSEFCAKTEWFDGEMAFGCDAFMCPPGTFNKYGRRIGDEGCEICNFRGSAVFYGSTVCGVIYPQGMTESNMLEQVFTGTGGLSWENNQNWLNDNVSACEWYGVSCESIDGSDYVTELDLSNNGVQGLVPSIIFYLPHLKKLNLGQNNVSVKFGDISDYTVLKNYS